MSQEKSPRCCPKKDTINVPDSLKNQFNQMGTTTGIVSRLPQEHLETLLRSFKALSDRSRLKIFGMLTVIPSCACMLKEATGLSDSRLSYHISILREAGLIHGKKEKNWIIYSLTVEGGELATLLKL
jgi:ArsR family transcriptional regulator, arsenate/arsenite/antimonite-responsive transcriptional repressor